MIVQLRVRRGTAAEWATDNPVLAEGEPGYEKDSRLLKVGDGETAWTDLAYSGVDPRAVVLELTSDYQITDLDVSGPIDFEAAPIHDIRLSANVALTLVDNPRVGGRLTVLVRQDAVGSRTMAWPSAFRFAGGSAPALSTAADAVDLFEFVYDGARWRELGRSLGTTA